eukprot:Seg6943.2 transcript_id=Seg6943.2/GoldUCD/mRNA.D3Y31 product="Casein kinase 1-like protein 13" protein_id=Seg6943.2/GoldUCD/D3Y31
MLNPASTLAKGCITFPYCLDVLGEGSFGIVKVGYFSKLAIDVAVKMPKVRSYNMQLEARIIASLNGHTNFPFVFGVHQNCIIVELIATKTGSGYFSHTIHSELFNCESQLSGQDWLKLSHAVAKAVSFIHGKNLLHNDIKEDNVLLKFAGGEPIPILADFGKATHSSCPKQYFLGKDDRKRYNEKHRHLAHELRNVDGAHQSHLSDVYSLGRIYKAIGFLRNLTQLYVMGKLMKHQSMKECT